MQVTDRASGRDERVNRLVGFPDLKASVLNVVDGGRNPMGMGETAHPASLFCVFHRIGCMFLLGLSNDYYFFQLRFIAS